MPPHIRCILSTRCILTHLHSYAFTCIHDALHSRSVAFKCICMHSNIRCILWTRCILTHSHSYAFKRMKMHSLTHAFRESAEGLTQLQDSCMLTRVCIRMHSYAFLCIIMHSDTYGNAYECIIIRMHQNATHVHAPKCAYMHHVQNAYIR